jgi:uncharacterized protein (UPF0210 family)
MTPVTIRTLTAGVDLPALGDLGPVAAALDLLARTRRRLEEAGHPVQTHRVALPPLLAGLDPAARWTSLAHVRRLDALAAERGALLSVGPVWTHDEPDSGVASWIADLNASTEHTHASIAIASPEGGVHRHGARVAAEAMHALARTPQGLGNFRFAAAANIPAGTPFFPVAHHHGAASIALGLQSADLVREAFAGARDPADAGRALRAALAPPLMALERLVDGAAQQERVQYLGIDTSPAPLLAVSIAHAIEALTQRPFGTSGTLDACALVTATLRDLPVRTCGYCGLMLPVLEDEGLAARAVEGRYGVRELLLYSSVCGTGLDCVPLPGDTGVEPLAALLTDVAALSTRLAKPLSARLLLVPGARAGDLAHLDNRYLTASTVFELT